MALVKLGTSLIVHPPWRFCSRFLLLLIEIYQTRVWHCIYGQNFNKNIYSVTNSERPLLPLWSRPRPLRHAALIHTTVVNNTHSCRYGFHTSEKIYRLVKPTILVTHYRLLRNCGFNTKSCIAMGVSTWLSVDSYSFCSLLTGFVMAVDIVCHVGENNVKRLLLVSRITANTATHRQSLRMQLFITIYKWVFLWLWIMCKSNNMAGGYKLLYWGSRGWVASVAGSRAGGMLSITIRILLSAPQCLEPSMWILYLKVIFQSL